MKLEPRYERGRLISCAGVREEGADIVFGLCFAKMLNQIAGGKARYEIMSSTGRTWLRVMSVYVFFICTPAVCSS
jgi:hypothetical protein